MLLQIWECIHNSRYYKSCLQLVQRFLMFWGFSSTRSQREIAHLRQVAFVHTLPYNVDNLVITPEITCDNLCWNFTFKAISRNQQATLSLPVSHSQALADYSIFLCVSPYTYLDVKRTFYPLLRTFNPSVFHQTLFFNKTIFPHICALFWSPSHSRTPNQHFGGPTEKWIVYAYIIPHSNRQYFGPATFRALHSIVQKYYTERLHTMSQLMIQNKQQYSRHVQEKKIDDRVQCYSY